MMPSTDYHVPVLLDAVLAAAAGCRRAVDGTVGGGGHAERLLASGAEVLAIDRDPEAIAAARARLGDERVTWVTGRFAAPNVLGHVERFHPDFVLLDLGVSSRHLDADRRGFSFREGAPLDMRMSGAGPTAAELLNHAAEAELARIFREYGDERKARRLARAVVERRARHPFATSDDLVGAIRRALGPTSGPPDFARIFQAVRIAVNDELEELETALPVLRDALAPGGRLAVITYHSGEDRIVKLAFREWARACICPPGQPVCTCRGHALGRLHPRRPVVPTPDEIAGNPRARSAKLRVFEKADGR
ncbi:MAG TPA: 16S rRNA (cytosine(1402)-N(4))-methyltransferase RsmH [Gemmatimonadales bacterium]|nr:16S rRNA (cytosine(1402)-N(4))-methyltransferase RsmH [Gemmatimonadales bacterium]